MDQFDVIIIGAGTNGLTLGAYLSKAGQKVLLLEKNYEMGGGLATEDPGPGGFYWNTHSLYHMMMDYAPPYVDFAAEFERRVKYVYPEPSVAMPFPDGRWICLYRDVDKACASIAQFSQKDADAYREMRRKHKEYMDEFLAPATYVIPSPALEQLPKLESTAIGREISEFTAKSPKQIVDGLFENDQVRALMLYLACHWGLEPEQDGLGYLVPLYLDRHVNHGLCVGGSHQLAGALVRVIVDNGGELQTAVLIKRIIVEGGAAIGVELEDGTVFKGKVIASSITPQQTFVDLIGEENLDKEFADKVRDWKWEKWSLLGMHLALWQAPDFSAAAANPDINKAFMYVVGFESEKDVEEHFNAIAENRMPKKPGFYCSFPTVHDRLQAPTNPDRHTATITLEAPYNLNGDADNWWKRELKLEYLEATLQVLSRYAPNMTKHNVMWEYISSPLDVSNKFLDMVQGSYKQGAYLPLQMGYLRPNEDCSQSRTPIRNLYLCGASCYSGGLVIFGPSYIAANVIAEDCGIKKWWQEPEHLTRAREKGYF